jgi:type I site-specific restriction endonuclease
MKDLEPARMQDTSHVRELVQGFRENHKALKDENTSEAVIRGEYIDRFWMLLGWDVHNRKHRSLAEKDVVVEANIGTIEGQHIRQRRPDYLFRIDGFPRFIVEAKKCTVDIATDKEAIFQAKTYAWSAQIPFAILTNFERFRLFDTTIKPHYLAPEGEVIADFDLKFDDYEQQWDVLEQTF